MATAPASSTEHHREHEKTGDKTGKSQIVVVDLEGSQSPVAIRRLRKGRGRLFNHVERIISDLVEDGTVKSTAQPVVIVVRASGFWPFERYDDDRDALIA
jgi:hypothetical protein